VLDPFCGSGTNLIAAERTGRCGFGIELDPLYCDVSLRRLQSVCGLQAVLESTGQRFEEVAVQRQQELAAAEA
jgi:DNA modification methylase